MLGMGMDHMPEGEDEEKSSKQQVLKDLIKKMYSIMMDQKPEMSEEGMGYEDPEMDKEGYEDPEMEDDMGGEIDVSPSVSPDGKSKVEKEDEEDEDLRNEMETFMKGRNTRKPTKSISLSMQMMGKGKPYKKGK